MEGVVMARVKRVRSRVDKSHGLTIRRPDNEREMSGKLGSHEWFASKHLR